MNAKTLILTVSLIAFSFVISAENYHGLKKINSSSEQKSVPVKQIHHKKKPLQPNEPIPSILKKKFSNPKPVQKKKYHSLKKVYKNHHHKPYNKIEQKYHHYQNPKYYCYQISPHYLYRGLWIRWNGDFPDGFFFYNGYPYYVYYHYLHRYSDDPGSYDLVDSYTNETYAVFYGNNLKESYDRAADIRDILNNRYGNYRYFVAERFVYDPDYQYNWNPDDFSDWLWF